MSKEYDNIELLIADVNSMPEPGGIYSKGKIDSRNIESVSFVVLQGDEEEDLVKVGGRRIPRLLSGDGYYSWIDAPTFQDIISNKRSHDLYASNSALISAIFHYLEHDDFLD